MIKIIKSGEHYHNDEDWLSTYWHFSFAHYQDPQKMNYGPLRVFNDDIIQPGKGFGFHPHRDMEIVTYVIDGELEHRDDQGNQGVIHPGEIQRMTAGSGITHSEYKQALHIHQDAAIYVSSLAAGKKVEHKLARGRKAYVFVIEGKIKLNNSAMETRDAAKIENEERLAIQADKPTELILLDLPEKYAINN